MGTQFNSTSSSITVEESGQAYPSKKERRWWGRSIAAAGDMDKAASISSPNEDVPPSVDNDRQTDRDVRRLQKALREIGFLETRQSDGEKLRRNQIEKVNKKDQFL